MISRLLLCVSLVVLPLTAQPRIEPALQQLKRYQFGADPAPLNTIEQAVTAVLSNSQESAQLAAQLASFLQGDGTYDAKQFVCRQLVLIASDAEIPALTACLHSSRSKLEANPNVADPGIETGNTRLAHMALFVLRGMNSPAVDSALSKVLPYTTGATRTEVLHTLGQRRAVTAVKTITPYLDDPDTPTANAAAVALGWIGGKTVIKPLLRAFGSAVPNRRPILAEALLRAAEGLATSGAKGPADSVATRLLRDAPDDRLEASALRLLVMARGEEATDAILDALAQDGTALQAMAAQLAREVPGRPVTCGLTHLLPVQALPCDCGHGARHRGRVPASTYGQTLVLAALADRRDASALPAIIKITQSDLEVTAVAAVRALGVLGTNAVCTETLLALATQSRPALRTAARDSLDRLRGSDIEPALLSALDHSQPEVQVEAIRSLGSRSTTNAVPLLLRTVTTSAQPSVRSAALRVLRDLAVPTDLPALVKLLLAAPAAEHSAVSAAIVATARRASDDSLKTAALLAALSTASSSELQTSLLNTLGQIGGTPALSALRDALRQLDPGIRLAALRQLADWASDEPLADLLNLVKTTSEDQPRTIALRGYVRLLGMSETRSAAEALKLYREAMNLARSTDEKRAVLAGLARVKSRDALEYAASFTRDDTLRAEAELATTEIGRGTLGAWRDATLAALKPIADHSSNSTAQSRASEVLTLAAKLADFITAWQVSPPYSQTGLAWNQLFDVPFAPEIPDQSDTVPWRVMPAALNPEQPWLVDLLALHGGEQKVAYLRTRLVAGTAQSATLELGSDDGIKVWLNGKIVFTNNAQRAVALAQERITLPLNAGANDLLLKVTQNVQGWGAVARLASPDVRIELP